VNVVLMRFRKKKLTEDSLDETSELDENDEKPPMQFGARDLRLSGVIDRVNLERAINQLPPGCKEMFVLHDVAGYCHEEIAEIAGCSVGNSKSQLHKARVRLREILCNDLRRTNGRRVRRTTARASWPSVPSPNSSHRDAAGAYRLAFGDA
jgi:RNA polymerase sigma-70 factor (ECF subfamily)